MGGLSDFLFGDKGKRAAEIQQEENERNRAILGQTREDVFSLFPQIAAAREQGGQAALDIFGQTIPQQMDVFSQGNVGAQRALTQGLPQIQAALLGQPIDFGQIQPQRIDFSTDFAQQQTPFTEPVALPESEPFVSPLEVASRQIKEALQQRDQRTLQQQQIANLLSGIKRQQQQLSQQQRGPL